MKITLLGTGVAIPRPERFQSGLIVDGGQGPVLFDCGCGVLQRISQSGYKHTDISSMFLTHLHLDHCGDVLALIKANWLCDVTDMHIWGPGGTKQWLLDILAAYPYMEGKADIRVTELTAGQVVTANGLEVECIGTIHAVPSLGFKVTCAGSSMLYSGDTEPAIKLIRACEGADLLVHECSFPDTFDVTNHTTPGVLASELSGTDIKRIVLVHLYPHTCGFEDRMVEVLARACQCPVEIGYDLQEINI